MESVVPLAVTRYRLREKRLQISISTAIMEEIHQSQGVRKLGLPLAGVVVLKAKAKCSFVLVN